MPDKIMIEVSFALPKKQIIIPVLVPKGISIKEAIELSGILKKFGEIDLDSNQGLFVHLYMKPDDIYFTVGDP